MQQGRIVLAGDAAHIVTPAGGKGMNLAIQDAEELAGALVDRVMRGDDQRLDAYTTVRLPQVWRAVEFSHWMLQHLLLAPGGRPEEAAFHHRLRASRLARLMSGGPMAMDFARCYVGVF
jgi:p-hydroxybenzoate 3-monooxygenase